MALRVVVAALLPLHYLQHISGSILVAIALPSGSFKPLITAAICFLHRYRRSWKNDEDECACKNKRTLKSPKKTMLENNVRGPNWSTGRYVSRLGFTPGEVRRGTDLPAEITYARLLRQGLVPTPSLMLFGDREHSYTLSIPRRRW